MKLTQISQLITDVLAPNPEQEHDLRRVMLVGATALFLYGFVLGIRGSIFQAISSAVKLPILFTLTTLVAALPLWTLARVAGRRPSIGESLRFCIFGLASGGLVLAGLAPIALFFTVVADNYTFLKFLHMAFLTIASMVAIRSMKLIVSSDGHGRIWTVLSLFLYGFVGCQLAWNMRPFLGYPGLPFELWRHFGSNLYVDLYRTIIG